MKIAYLDCFSGISGDMLLGALVDAGVPFAVMENAVAALGVEARLELRRVNRSGIDAAKVDVKTEDGRLAEAPRSGGDGHAHSHGHDHSHGRDLSHSSADLSVEEHSAAHTHGRTLSMIQEMIRRSSLEPEVQATALRAFQLLGDAEAKIHNVPVEKIHFHEVGAIDAIADIVAASAGCHWLGIERWICSPLNVGGGHVHCAHGKFPVPAPATLELLRDLPVYSSGVQKELVTPTGAALLRALGVTPSVTFPAMRMSATGYGAGSRDLPGQPNVLRLVIGQTAEIAPGEAAREMSVGVIETTLDDATPELLAYVSEKLLAAGASDVWRTPILMKKGRMGTQLTILCSPEQAPVLEAMVFAETTTLGLRYREETKLVLGRQSISVATPWGAVRVKIGIGEDAKISNAAPEFEDCKNLAQAHGIALKEVMQTAMAAYQESYPHAQKARA